MRRVAAVLVLVSLLTACASDEEASYTAGNVTVVDAIRLVSAVATTDPPAELAQSDHPLALRGDGLDQLIIGWKADSCVGGYTLRISGNAISAVIEPSARASGCEGRLTPEALRLDLTRAIDAEKVDVRFAGEPAS